MHPVTLQFSSPKLEAALRSSQFQSSMHVAIFLLLAFFAMHVMITMHSHKYLLISAIYLPLIVVAMLARAYLGRLHDQCHAHNLNMQVWGLILTVGPWLQRATVFLGWHPRIEVLQATVYMGSYVGVALLIHLQFFDHAWKLWITGSVFLSLATCGWQWTGDEGWSTFGQPYDTAFVGVALLVGWGMGHPIEAMLRSSFLQREELKALAQGAGSSFPADVQLERDLSEHGYEQLGLIGRGASGDVFLVRRVSAPLARTGGYDDPPSSRHARGGSASELGACFAMKRVGKGKLSPAQIRRVEEESCILEEIEHPFLVALHDAFQTARTFYFAIDYASGGDLTHWFDVLTAGASRVVISEVLLAVEYLHGRGILYRDVKPENTLVCADGHVMLADFGVSKRVHRTFEWAKRTRHHQDAHWHPHWHPPGRQRGLPSHLSPPGGDSGSPMEGAAHALAFAARPSGNGDVNGTDDADDGDGASSPSTRSQVGTVSYMAPELFTGEAYSFEVDYWALAVMLHEILTGNTVGSRTAPTIAADHLAPDAADLLRRMLKVDRAERLGVGEGGREAIRAHAYFDGMPWASLLHKLVPGPLRMASAHLDDPSATASEPSPPQQLAGVPPERPSGGVRRPASSILMGVAAHSVGEHATVGSADEAARRAGAPPLGSLAGADSPALRRRIATPVASTDGDAAL